MVLHYTMDNDIEWVALRTLQIIKTYLQKVTHCTLISIKSWTNGVPDIFDCSNCREGKLIFSDGFLNGYIDPDGYKTDIEMETCFSDAAIEGQTSHYMELLMFHTEQLFRTEPAFWVDKCVDGILHIHIVSGNK